MLSVLFLAGCSLFNKDKEIVWEQFNADGDSVEIEVLPTDELGDPISVDLHSSLGEVIVGSATVTPSSGPVGTDHRIVVIVRNSWEEVVQRVTVEADAGDRGNHETELRQDSADHGIWAAEIRSLGSEDETRTDTFTFVLWQPEDVQVEVEPEDTGD